MKEGRIVIIVALVFLAMPVESGEIPSRQYADKEISIMDMFKIARLVEWIGADANDEFTSLADHDKRFHGGHYEAGQKCNVREKLSKFDSPDKLVSKNKYKKLTAEENKEALSNAKKYLNRIGKKYKKTSEDIYRQNGMPYTGIESDEHWPPIAYKDGKPFTGVMNGRICIEGNLFNGRIADRFYRHGVELPEAFQKGGTKSKYRQLRNAQLEKLIDADDGTFNLQTGKNVGDTITDGYQMAFQTTDSEDPNKPTYVSDEEYDALCREFIRQFGKLYIGVFDVPEISVRVKSKKRAKQEAFGKYNQNSIYDWKNSKLIFNKRQDTSTNSVKII